jgi:4-amino-4-deoxy-L-arabinose transferase-like glycosyltransferase
VVEQPPHQPAAPPQLATLAVFRKHHNLPFYLLVAGALLFLTISRMAQPGMFLDGVTYASIARNLAAGAGTFWTPSYTTTVYPIFQDHPPLGFGLQAVGFFLAGDHLFVERAYSVLMGGLTAWLILLLWRRTIADERCDWLPLVFWLLPATVTWSIVNNMLETTVAVFTTFAVFALVVSLRAAGARAWLWASLSGLSVIAAVLTKGPAGFFPIAAPVLVALLVPQHARSAARRGLVMLATLVMAGGILFLVDASRAALSTYWNQQVVASISGARGGGRFGSLARHLNGIILRMGGLLVLTWVWARLAGRSSGRNSETSTLAAIPSDGWVRFFFALALAGSIPMLASARIAGHYLVPSIPFYALGFAGLAQPLASALLDRWRSRSIGPAVVSAIGLTLIVASAAAPILFGPIEPRDRDWIADYRAVASAMPRETTISTCVDAAEDWRLHAYLQRFFRVSLDVDASSRHRFYLQLKDRPCSAPPSCRVASDALHFALLECRR